MSDVSPPDRSLISLVVPVYNERESLVPLLAEIDAVGSANGLRVEVIFIDDGSTDDSWKIIADLAPTHPHVVGIRFRRNFGKASALAAGFKRARGATVITMDADLQDDPHEIPNFLSALKDGKDVVSGWKKVRRDPWHKVWPSRVFNGAVSLLTGVHLHDHNCGMKAYRAEVVREVKLYGEMHRFIPVLAESRGFRVGELVIQHRARKFGRSKYGFRRFAKGFLDLITVRFLTAFGGRPQHFLGSLALVALLMVLALGGGLAFNAVLRWWDQEYGMGPWGQLIAFAIAGGIALLGMQLFIAGLLAELIVARMANREEFYCVAELIPPLPSPTDTR